MSSSISYKLPVYVTGHAKIGHICAQEFGLIFNFNLQYLLKCKSYDNEICAYWTCLKGGMEWKMDSRIDWLNFH